MDEQRTVFVGIDVSKDRLDVHLRPSGEAFCVPREGKGMDDLVIRLQRLSVALVVLEATGGFEATVAAALAGVGLPLCVVNPRQIRDFARAMGRLAKTDTLDAEVIALFAERVRPQARPLREPERVHLAELVGRRRQIIEMIGMETNRGRQAIDKPLAQQSVDFTNKGAVIGNMVFGAGDVALHFYTGSSLTGDLTAGTGTNTISLNGSGNGAFSSPIADFQTITKLDDGTWTLSGVVSGATLLNVTQGTLILSAANIYSGGTTINGGTLAAGGVDVFSANSHTVVMNGGTLDLHGFDQTLSNGLENAGTVQLGIPDPTPPGTTLTVAGNYVGAGGALNLNTFLGGDGSPSDVLIINGGSATGSTFVYVTNVGGPGEETTANGIQVVSAINGATTAPGAFSLGNGELRAGAFDYDLFHGGVGGSNPGDWFLRSSFVVPPIPPEPPIPPIPPFPPNPPPDPLPPGIYPIIGPELATYGVVQPLARQLGLSILGTLDDRVGDTLRAGRLRCCGCAETSSVDLPTRKPAAVPTKKPGPAPCPLVFALGLGPLLRTDDRQPLSSLCRSARQRQPRRLPGRHRSSAGISDRRSL